MSFDPITAALDVAGKIIDRVFPDPNQAAIAKLEMFKAQQAGEFKQMDQDFQIMLEQIKTNAVEAASSSVFKGGWRPGAGWVCVWGLAYTFLIQPLGTWLAVAQGRGPLPVIDTMLLIQLLLGMLGLGGLRTFEKFKGVSK